MKKYWLLCSLAISALALAVACGKKDDGGGGGGAAAPATVAATPTSCPAGQLHDFEYGCLPINACQPNYATYQGRCTLMRTSNAAPPVANQPMYPADCQPGTANYNNGLCSYNGNSGGGNYNGGYQYGGGYTYRDGYFYPNYNVYNGGNWGNGYVPYYGNNGGGFRFSGGVWVRF